MVEAIDICERIASTPLIWTYSDENRAGDHIWWIGNLGKFRSHFPRWKQTYDIHDILQESHDVNADWWLGSTQEVAV
jgi:CDP-paratose 2-epimerase